ncbi:MAG: ImmA/IrrE family metallo-endopeptidase [Nostoc sp. DedQUE12b]|uniref:ImmA/IrrE family metallo-endopeptidase n=1 Tax=Nostoc sp. DedQUE12b TaxID=3075398 RepID=UPI002AD1EA07|nr:ImmA/IrrE family metallo-endopeptidase [Nostoc sp. DedQUE12b]MDZ8089962.1 ImmA/IrrE family metallo-endopeptidase [Nostoc sp. DedQUE12b]
MRYLSTKEIEKNATDLLESLKSMDLPVRVDAIAYRLGLMVEFVPLGEEVSGLLVIENGKGTIGINEAHIPVRQRFTLAHEIGHYILHKEQSELFIDKKYTAIFRDSRSSSGELRREIQANQFAAALLMPRKLVENEIKARGLDLGDDCMLRKLAEDFEVSIQAMAYRLSNMNIFPSS